MDAPLALAHAIVLGERKALAKGITLVESAKPEDRLAAVALIEALPQRIAPALRLAITGPPGAGKSTLIDSLGHSVSLAGQRLAVLAIDPSSAVSGGSILGDKTRMRRLLADPQVFVRPSPSGGNAGGVAERTREVMLLCEAAGFDSVFVETVGVGQGEHAVRDMVDVCLVVLIPGAGDDLTGIKRGVLEVGDVFVVNKADGAGTAAAATARGMYESALGILLGSSPPVLCVSALEGLGIEPLWQALSAKFSQLLQSGELDVQRSEQRHRWFESLVRTGAADAFLASPGVPAALSHFGELVRQGSLDAVAAARRVFQASRATGR